MLQWPRPCCSLVTRNGEMISHLHTPARTNLKLPLARHDLKSEDGKLQLVNRRGLTGGGLCVDTGDFNASLRLSFASCVGDG